MVVLFEYWELGVLWAVTRAGFEQWCNSLEPGNKSKAGNDTHEGQAIEHCLDNTSSERRTTELTHISWYRYVAFNRRVVVDNHI